MHVTETLWALNVFGYDIVGHRHLGHLYLFRGENE
jgi:hypothetical protein